MEERETSHHLSHMQNLVFKNERQEGRTGLVWEWVQLEGEVKGEGKEG
jgi:hypothetical protein